jgi:peroxisome-assembly ATPase
MELNLITRLQSLGPADYITLASTFHTVAIASIPAFKVSQKNQARRFISLIDALYEARCKLICQAETGIDDLFFADAAVDKSTHDGAHLDPLMAESVSETRESYRPNILSYEEVADGRKEQAPPSTPPALETLSIFSGQYPASQYGTRVLTI